MSSSHVLKANDARDLGSRGVAFNFEDLRHQAEAHLAAARAEAAELLEQTRREAEQLKQKLHAEARDAGLQEGLKDAAAQIERQAQQIAEERFKERLQTTLPALVQAAEALRDEREQWLLHWDRAAIELGVAIAGKLVRSTLAVRPDLTTGMIAEALQLAVGQPQLRVYLHPQDRARLGDRAEQVVEALTACATPEIVDDPALAPGECRIETRHGEIDARLDTMLQRIAEELLSG